MHAIFEIGKKYPYETRGLHSGVVEVTERSKCFVTFREVYESGKVGKPSRVKINNKVSLMGEVAYLDGTLGIHAEHARLVGCKQS